MQILITGAAGFIGQILAKELLGDASHTVYLSDVIEPPTPAGAKYPQNAKLLKVDLVTEAQYVVVENLDVVFMLHGIMSSGSEANFDLGMQVNINATRGLLDTIRHKRPGIRVIYASSTAVYGRPLPEVVDDSIIPTPESSYGVEKLVCEALINEYTRRGFINGLACRFPTISVRHGLPTAAASSFLSGMIREPMNGKPCVIPVTDRQFRAWICSPKTLVANLLHSMTMSTVSLHRHIRQINLPGISISVQEMMDVLEKVGGPDKLLLVKEEPDPALLPILQSWPTAFDIRQALALGFKRDASFEQAVIDYKETLSSL